MWLHVIIWCYFCVYKLIYLYSLLRVSLDVASEDGTGEVMVGVEVCECPEGYAGTSCEVSNDELTTIISFPNYPSFTYFFSSYYFSLIWFYSEIAFILST